MSDPAERDQAAIKTAFDQDLVAPTPAPLPKMAGLNKPANGYDSGPKGQSNKPPNGNESASANGFAGARAQADIGSNGSKGSRGSAPAPKGQPWPGGPAGDKVERINFQDAGTIISMIQSQCRSMDLDKNGISSDLLNLFGGDFFYGASMWTSNWRDDGWSDTWNAGLADVDMKLDLALSIVNARERTEAEVESTGTAAGAGTSASTSSTAKTVGGNAEVSGSVGGGGKPGAGAKVGGNLSQADTTATTTGNMGSRSDTAAYKNKRMVADIQLAVTVRYDATIPGADYSTDHATFNIGEVIYLRKMI